MPSRHWGSDVPYTSRAREGFPSYARLRADNPHAVTAPQVGLGNVDNTSDADKPISDATQAALDAKAREAGYAEIAASVSIAGTPVTLIAAAAIAFDGATVCEIAMFTPGISVASHTTVTLRLMDNGVTELGDLGTVDAKADELKFPLFASRRFVPPAGSHAFSLIGQRTSGTGAVTFHAGAGGAGQTFPAFLRVVIATLPA